MVYDPGHVVLFLSRLFLKRVPSEATQYPANIKKRLAETGDLPHFTGLNEREINWATSKRVHRVSYDQLPVKNIYSPENIKRTSK